MVNAKQCEKCTLRLTDKLFVSNSVICSIKIFVRFGSNDARSLIHERTISLRFLRNNLERSQTWSFCMDFLNNREGGSFQVFLLSPLQCTAIELWKMLEVSWVWRNRNLKAKLLRWLWNSKKEYSDFCLDFVQEFGPSSLWNEVVTREIRAPGSPESKVL